MDHTFKTEIAITYGIKIAAFLNNMAFWVQKNAANQRHFYDGRYWTYNSLEAFTKIMPYFSIQSIRTILQKCQEEDLIIKGNYNKTKYDQTCWYTLTEKGLNLFPELNNLCISCKEQIDLLKLTNEYVENNKPIPDIKPDTKPISLGSNIINNAPAPIVAQKEEEKITPKPPQESEWDLIDIRSLEVIGFTKDKLTEIKKYGRLTTEQVKRSINNLTIALSSGHKMQNPLAYFMTLMKNGDMFIYEKSRDDKNSIATAKRYEIANKQNGQVLSREQQNLREIERRKSLGWYEEFDKWYEKLSPKERDVFEPLTKFGGIVSAQKIALRMHFFKTIKEEEEKNARKYAEI